VDHFLAVAVVLAALEPGQGFLSQRGVITQ
jgi:hypothetical protein